MQVNFWGSTVYHSVRGALCATGQGSPEWYILSSIREQSNNLQSLTRAHYHSQNPLLATNSKLNATQGFMGCSLFVKWCSCCCGSQHGSSKTVYRFPDNPATLFLDKQPEELKQKQKSERGVLMVHFPRVLPHTWPAPLKSICPSVNTGVLFSRVGVTAALLCPMVSWHWNPGSTYCC